MRALIPFLVALFILAGVVMAKEQPKARPDVDDSALNAARAAPLGPDDIASVFQQLRSGSMTKEQASQMLFGQPYVPPAPVEPKFGYAPAPPAADLPMGRN